MQKHLGKLALTNYCVVFDNRFICAIFTRVTKNRHTSNSLYLIKHSKSYNLIYLFLNKKLLQSIGYKHNQRSIQTLHL